MAVEKPVFFRWRAARGFIVMLSFFALASFLEYLIVYFFSFSGLTDNFTFNFFSIAISPLFHIMPLGVTFVLISSWIYLTKKIAATSFRLSHEKKTFRKRKKPYRRVSKKTFSQSFKNSFKRIGKKFRIGQTSKSSSRKIVRMSSFGNFFEKTAVRCAVIVLLVFLVSILFLHNMVFPSFLSGLATELHSTNTSFHWFVLKTIETSQGIAQSPIGWLAPTLNEALRAIAPNFRNAIEGLGNPITEPFTNLDVMSEYLICQNATAWITAIVTMLYGEYISRAHRKHKPR